MKADRFSAFLTRIMLAIMLVLAAVAVAVGMTEGRSYMAAAAAGALVFACIIFINKKIKHFSPVKLKTGIVLSCVCFISQLIFVMLVRIEPSADFATFWRLACALSEGKVYENSLYIALFPHIFGYSSFLGVFLKLFGEKWFVAPILNVCLTTVSGICIYLICLEVFNIRAAAAAYALWIVCPSKLLYNTMVISEPYYTALILVLMVLMLRTEKNCEGAVYKAVLPGVIAGALLRLINTARPIAAVLLIAFFIWLFMLRGKALLKVSAWKFYAVFAAAMLVVYIPTGSLWSDYMESRLQREVSDFPGYSVAVGFNEASQGRYSDDDMNALLDNMYETDDADEAQSRMFELAKERITSGDINFPHLFANKLGALIGNDEGGAFYLSEALSPMQYSILALISNVFYYAVVIMLFASAVKLLARPLYSSFLLVPLYIVGLIMAQLLVEVAGRYHYSAIPMMIIIAAGLFRNGRQGAKI